MNTKKRNLFREENVHEGKKSKHEDQNLVHQKNMYGDGVAWFRGAMIGQGSFGRVFVASLKNIKSRYSLYPPIMAVKSASVSASSSIQKEKEVLDNIQGCSNVIKCFGEEITTRQDGQMVYNLLLEYGSGGTLNDLIKKTKGKGLPEFDVRRYTRSILCGLSHIHKKGYVHCDLKPENVLLVANDDGETGELDHFIAKIGDFGLTKRAAKNNNYGAYSVRGTPMYLSPEASDGVQEQPADIWAVGCIVFEMLTGKPFWGFWFLNQDSGIGDENNLFSVSGISAGARSFLKKCLCRKVTGRLSASMLLKHPFLQGFVDEDDDINEVEESYAVCDLNMISSSSSSFYDDEGDDDDDDDDADYDDDGIWYEEDVDVIVNEDHKNARLHEVHEFPVLAMRV